MATRQIKNQKQLAKMVAWLGRVMSWMANEEARRKRAIDRHTAAIDQLKIDSSEKVARWEVIRDDLTDSIFGFVQPRRDQLLTGRDKSFRVATGTIGWDEGRSGATQFLVDDDVVVAAIEARLSAELVAEIIKVEKTVRKLPLKKAFEEHPELVDLLADVVDIPLVDRLVITPDNVQKGFRRPISWLLSRAQNAAQAAA